MSQHPVSERPPKLNETQEQQPFPVLPVRDTVLFPHAVLPLAVGRESSLQLINSLGEDKTIIVVAQREARVDSPQPSDLYTVGTSAVVHKVVKMPNQSLFVFAEGLERVRLGEFTQLAPFMRARVSNIPEAASPDSSEIEALQRNVLTLFQQIVAGSPTLSDELSTVALNIDEPGRLVDFIASSLPSLSTADKQETLETTDVRVRLEKINQHLAKELNRLQLRNKIQSEVQDRVQQTQREYYLREQMKAIQKELGEQDEGQRDVEDLKKKIDDAGMPEEVKKAALKELGRLSRMSPMAADYSLTRNYVEWLAVLPWAKTSGQEIEIPKAKEILDTDHYDLEKVKDRILDYLSVRRLKPNMKGPILCFVGPPGVGKTSLGKSIARALGRKFVRLSLGGVHDEAEIRGHRRTYIGAMPGRILQQMKVAGARNPVFMLDEIDKVGADWRGDPSSALLEVLDPEQNRDFSDHYLEVPYDLSQVLFITTANVVDTIIAPLRDRMEIIRLPGYTEDEKMHIAQQFLVPRQLREHGLTDENLEVPEPTLRLLIREYTHEAGVRNLDREIANIARKIPRRIAEGQTEKVLVEPGDVMGYLGPPRFEFGVAELEDQVGAVTGVAVNEYGGDVMTVEAILMQGRGEFALTGQIGKVMEESARAAVSYARSHALELGLKPGFFEDHFFHIHVPAGALPQDGPSAGITMAAAVVSALTGRRVRREVAMTGEITLRGKVLPIGGLKEKLLAAHRAGIKIFILPEKNRKDLHEVPEEVKQSMELVMVKHVDEVLDKALLPAAARPSTPGLGFRRPLGETQPGTVN